MPTRLSPSRSLTGSTRPVISRLSAGRLFIAFASVAIFSRAELAVFELVLDVKRKLSFLDAIADVFGRIGGHRTQLDFPRVSNDVEKEIFGKRIDLTFDVHRRRFVEFGFEVDISGRLRL